MTHDIHIRFKEMPESLDEFLSKEGYSEIEKTTERTLYGRSEDDGLQIYYFPETVQVKEGVKPNWQESGHNIVSELDINYVLDVWDEAERLSEAIRKKFDAVFYDSNSDKYIKNS